MNKRRVVVSLMTSQNDYQREQAAAVEYAASRLGVAIDILYADNDALTQSQQLLDVIQNRPEMRPDAIICHPVGTPLEQVARAAVKAGIGWAVVNREVDYLTELRQNGRVPVACVMVDQEEVGRIQARQFSALLPDGGTVLYIQGTAGNYSAERRSIGMQATRKDNVEIRILRGRFTEESGYQTVKSWLRLPTARQTRVDVVGAQNDNMALGAQRAFSEDKSGHWSHLLFTGCDACGESGRGRIRQGLLTASVAMAPSAGMALDILVNALDRGTQPEPVTVLKPESFPTVEELARKRTAQGSR